MNNQSTRKTLEEVKIPKTIWFYWEQGWENAPYIVKKCYMSWKQYNQSWNLVFLDGNTVLNYLPDLSKISSNKSQLLIKRKALYADLIRINLLSKYGGVWVDATSFCCQPLDNWLGKYCCNGFFVFKSNHKNRLFAPWFIAASPGSHLLNQWCSEMNALMQNYSYKCYWHEYYRYNAELLDSLPNHSIIERKLLLLFLKISNKLRKFVLVFTSKRSVFNIIWTLKPVLKLGYLRYFFICDVFIKVIFTDPKYREIWESVPDLYVHDAKANALGKKGTVNTPISSHMKAHVDDRKSPVYKLSYKKKLLLPNNDRSQMNSYNYLIKSHGLSESLSNIDD